MHSPRRGAVTISSRQARLASSVGGSPCFANRLSQVGALSSMASRPLTSATSFAIRLCQPERNQLRARGFAVRVKNAFYPEAFRDPDEHRRVFDV